MTFEEKLEEVAKEAAKETARQKDQEYAEKIRAAEEDLARKMKQKGYPLDDIMEISGLNREEIEAL